MGCGGCLANFNCSLSPNFSSLPISNRHNKKPLLPSMHAHPNSLFSSTFLEQQVFHLSIPRKPKKKRMKRLLSPTVLLLILFHLYTTTSGQPSAPAQAPSASTATPAQSSPPTPSPNSGSPLVPSASSSAPPDVIAILKKARKFSTFIGLLKSTQMDSQINSELKKKSNSGFTIFAPTDSAFSDLKTGTLNSFTDEKKAALTKFHIINSFLTVSQFQTVSNPVHTSANGNTKDFPLNVIGNGTQVNITTGLVNTTVDSTVYSDGQLAVYEIPQVLLSQGILSPQAQSPAPAPLTAKPKKATDPLNSHAPSTSTSTNSVDSSEATAMPHSASIMVSIGVAVITALTLSGFD